ncbi:MAG: helix-turn-helix domain-containing protein [Burkholderiales bacterium]
MQPVAQRIRRLRHERGLSLRGLASRAGLSASSISQIESGRVSPSVATLEKICFAIDFPITALFGANERNSDVVILRALSRRAVAFPGSSLQLLESELRGKKMQPFLLALEAGVESEGRCQKETAGEQFALLLDGKAQLEYAGASHLLVRGDAVYFDAHKRHHWRNVGKGRALLLVVSAR